MQPNCVLSHLYGVVTLNGKGGTFSVDPGRDTKDNSVYVGGL